MTRRMELIDTAMGRVPADLAITNGKIVNVHTREIYEADVAIRGSRIACLGDINHAIGDMTRILDVGGQYLIPGLMDAHFHIESSNMMISELAKILLPRGVTAIMWDPHEVANALGVKGIKLFLDEAREVPLRVYLRVPGQVPGCLGHETAATEFGMEETRELLGLEEAIALAGDVNPNLILKKSLDGGRLHLRKVFYALKLKKTVDGQAPYYLTDREMNAFAAVGKMDSHVSRSVEEVIRALRLGLKTILQPKAFKKEDFERLSELAAKRNLDLRHILLCIDDKMPHYMIKEGSIDYNVRLAIDGGIDPITAIQMATINIAEHYSLTNDLGSIAPGKFADIVTLDDLERISVDKVIVDGELVAKGGKLLVRLETFQFPYWSKQTINLKRRVVPEDFEIRVRTGDAFVKVRVIDVSPYPRRYRETVIEELRVQDGRVLLDADRDILKIAVVERYRGTGNISKGFLKGRKLKRGAIASSYSHDHHNIAVFGTNEGDMAVAVNKIADIHGGIVIVQDGKTLGLIELPICGFISEEPVEVVTKKLERLDSVLKGLGCQPNIQVVATTNTLLNVGEIGISDRGLFDVQNYRPMELIVKEDE